MKPITYWIVDPTIEAITKKFGGNLEKLPYFARLNLIAAIARQEWPPDAQTGDAHMIWMDLDYLDWPARIKLIQGICEGL